MYSVGHTATTTKPGAKKHLAPRVVFIGTLQRNEKPPVIITMYFWPCPRALYNYAIHNDKKIKTRAKTVCICVWCVCVCTTVLLRGVRKRNGGRLASEQTFVARAVVGLFCVCIEDGNARVRARDNRRRVRARSDHEN